MNVLSHTLEVEVDGVLEIFIMLNDGLVPQSVWIKWQLGTIFDKVMAPLSKLLGMIISML